MDAPLVQMKDISGEYIKNGVMLTFGFTAPPHYHDFFEITLVTKGSLFLTANDLKSRLGEGSLTLIRPGDVHYKELSDDCQHINLGFPEKVMTDLFNFLGEGFDRNKLLNPDYPPIVTLLKVDISYIKSKLEKLDLIFLKESKIIETELRILLLELITKYFSLLEAPEVSDIPQWMQNAIRLMREKENFTTGLPALISITGKSHSYLCRIFGEKLNTTPTNFINEIKLEYTSNLLIHTNLDILTISLEAGFDNLSHFYHTFFKKYGMSPKNYRNSIRFS